MPRVTSYIVLKDSPVTFGGDTVSDAHFPFEVPGDLNVEPSSHAILAFRVDPAGDVELRIRLNDTVILTQTFDTAPQRSWHEVFSTAALRTEGNELIMSVPSDSPGGKVSVSDVVLFLPTRVA